MTISEPRIFEALLDAEEIHMLQCCGVTDLQAFIDDAVNEGFIMVLHKAEAAFRASENVAGRTGSLGEDPAAIAANPSGAVAVVTEQSDLRTLGAPEEMAWEPGKAAVAEDAAAHETDEAPAIVEAIETAPPVTISGEDVERAFGDEGARPR